MKYLLDSSTLIAYLDTEHGHYQRVATWLPGKQALVCPIVEGSWVRYRVRDLFTASSAAKSIQSNYDSGFFTFLPDSLTYAKADLSHVRGHKQVTDAYLVALAKSGGMKLATLDAPLAAAYPDDVELIPELTPPQPDPAETTSDEDIQPSN
jgi:predicted nucleic acid-binding protein